MSMEQSHRCSNTEDTEHFIVTEKENSKSRFIKCIGGEMRQVDYGKAGNFCIDSSRCEPMTFLASRLAEASFGEKVWTGSPCTVWVIIMFSLLFSRTMSQCVGIPTGDWLKFEECFFFSPAEKKNNWKGIEDQSKGWGPQGSSRWSIIPQSLRSFLMHYL